MIERGYHKRIAATNTDHASKMKETGDMAKQIANQNLIVIDLDSYFETKELSLAPANGNDTMTTRRLKNRSENYKPPDDATVINLDDDDDQSDRKDTEML